MTLGIAMPSNFVLADNDDSDATPKLISADDDSDEDNEDDKKRNRGRERIKVTIDDEEIESEVEIEKETENGKIKFKAKLSNGNSSDINIHPSEIRARIRERLQNTEFNTTIGNITLREKLHNNVPRVVYNVETNTHGKFLGVFKLSLKVDADVDPETGEVIEVHTPWWAFLVSSKIEEELEVNNETSE